MQSTQTTLSASSFVRITALLTLLLLASLESRAQSADTPKNATPIATVTLPSGVTVDIAGLDVQAPPEGAPNVLAVSSYVVTVTPPMGWQFSYDEQHVFDGLYRNWDLLFVQSSGKAVRVTVDVRALLASEGIQLVPRSDMPFTAPIFPVVPSADDAEGRRGLWVLAFLGLLALIAVVMILFGAADPLERWVAGTFMR